MPRITKDWGTIIIHELNCTTPIKSKLSEIDNPAETLHRAAKHLGNYNWWLSVGTAIALYRDGDFISDDSDIDIGIKTSGTPGRVEIPEFTLFRTTDIIISGVRKRTQLCYVDEKNNCIFDIYFYYTDIENDLLVTVSEFGIIHKPVFSIKKLQTKYGEFPFLHPVEDYFLDRYGETWKTPQNVKGKYYQKFLEH